MTQQITATHIDPTANLEQIRLECQQLAKTRAKVSAGVAVIPVPFLDVAVDVAMLAKLLPEINRRFGVEDKLSQAERQDNIKDRIISIGGLVATRGMVNQAVQGFGSKFIGKQVSKYIPMGGQLVAATLGYVIFKKIAFDHIEECYKIAKQAQQAEIAKRTAVNIDPIA